MAEGVGGSSKLLCRFYLSGACKEGSKCKFSHDRSAGKPDNVCRYYLKGSCYYGANCRYDHVGLKNRVPQNKKTNSTSQEPHSSALTLKEASKKLSKTDDTHRMVVLKKMDHSDKAEGSPSPTQNWLNAPIFVPRGPPKSYAAVCQPEGTQTEQVEPEIPMCPYAMEDECVYEYCNFLHGDKCDICDRPCLHPTNVEQREHHREECLKEIEKNMEHSFAIQRSIDKSCGICMEVIMEKNPPSERRFGILEKCTHVFCLNCIRQWRQTKQFESKNIRGCPECRTLSDFVTPSKYWVDDKDEKTKIIAEYKDAMSKKNCKYFKQGQGVCPFAGACFYSHVYPDGRKADLPPPRPRRRRNQYGEISDLDNVLLWDFFDLHNDMIEHIEHLEDFEAMGIFEAEDSDDSSSSDYEFFY